MTALSYGEAFDLDDLITLPMARAAALAQVSVRRLRYWDYIDLIKPAIRQRVSLRTTARLYTFDDLVALLVTTRMLKRGFSLQHVRRVVAHLKSRGYEAPLKTLTFATFHKEIYFQHPDGSWEGDLAKDQLVISDAINLELIRTMIRHGVERPEALYGKTENRRGMLGGKLVFAGTRIPVELVVRRLGRGASEKEIISSFPELTREDIATARGTVV